MRVIGLAVALSAALISGCQTPAEVAGYSDYRICRASILRPLLASESLIAEAERQIRVRGVDCSRYASAIMQEDANSTRALQALSQQGQQNKPVQTQCIKNGIFVNCTTY